jgi:hypothetical protein
MLHSRGLLALLAIGLLLLTTPPAFAPPYNEDYNFGPAYVPAFANKGNGLDMLPLTADDPAAVLNLGGALSCDVIDLTGDAGGLNIDWSFHNRKNDDDEQISLTAHSEFNLGIIAHGEYWCDMRQDNGAGATGAGPDGSTTSWSTDDWDLESNDSSSPGFEGWESASDYFWYNNAAANQRGLGGSKYYFEYKNPDQYVGTDIFDEPEKYRLAMRLRHTWAADPGNAEKRTYFGTDFNVEVRGFLIPISDIHTLPHGSLHMLFGWQSIDMADYVRDVIGAFVDASGNPINGLEVWDPSAGGYNNPGSDNPPPYKYVMIFQTSDDITLGPPSTNLAAAAAYYGVTDGVSGSRRCHIMFKGDSVANLPIDINPPAVATATNGAATTVNSWGKDEMRRSNYGPTNGPTPASVYGNLKVGKMGDWTDPVNPTGWLFDTNISADDLRVLYLPPGTAAATESWVELPTMRLPAGQLKPIRAEVLLAVDGGAASDINIALVDGTSVAAFCAFSQGGPATVGVGGSVDTGPVTGAAGSSVGTENVTLALTWTEPSTSLVLWYDPTDGSVKLDVNGAEVAAHTQGAATGGTVNGLYVWTSNSDGLAADQMGVQSGAFACNTPSHDIDGDGDVDLADFLVFQGCFNGPNRPTLTGTFPSCACFDTESDFDVDLVDFLSFQACFNGPNRPPACE